MPHIFAFIFAIAYIQLIHNLWHNIRPTYNLHALSSDEMLDCIKDIQSTVLYIMEFLLYTLLA